MDILETFQGQLEITRRHIIGQLLQEISQLQQELENPGIGSSQRKKLHPQHVIMQKRRLIDNLK